MKSHGEIKRSDLLRLLEAAPTSMSGVADVTRAVAAIDVDDFPLRRVSTEELRNVYQRRRARLMDAHPASAAVNGLLDALAEYHGVAVSVVTLESAGLVISVWLTEQADSILATMAADDNR